ncbi:MAG: ParB N-terminal domain-containing protein [Sphingomonas sp.]|uniref:ParB/RepB/Spo0J family partition protein n=1 Tax=Sphingomonas sp. TaxID=28214 RepID=UPI001AC423AF|nr:ParB N-terminal domain-containing protein [Sphingomonas sp.]MBN8816546.1 ParB N-terminal domain-containing protein [Sphingomonas sp.]
MDPTELPLDSAAPSKRGQKAQYVVELLAYDQTTVSPKNPRFGYIITDESVAPLVAELKAVGQAHDAIGERGPGGIVEILAGSRRREGCRILGTPLRARVYDEGSLTPEQALKIANREDRGALEVSLWDRSASWARMLDGKIVTNEARLADAVGEDKSAINRGLALQKAPAVILDLVADKRAISMSQWALVAPLLEDDESRARVLECAALHAGQTFGFTALTKKLTAAAAGKDEIRPVEVRNRHGRVIATVAPDHRGAFVIRVKSMAEQHPSFRLDHAKLIHTVFVDVLKDWFGDG